MQNEQSDDGNELYEEILFAIKNHAEDPDEVDAPENPYGNAEIHTVRFLISDLEAIVRAHEREAERRLRFDLATFIWNEEQLANKALLNGDPASAQYTHMSGRIVGLQRARDIVNPQLTQSKGYDGAE